jgi:hypothetical protein
MKRQKLLSLSQNMLSQCGAENLICRHESWKPGWDCRAGAEKKSGPV